MLTVLLGGARSGKSALAIDLARRIGRDVTFVATAESIAGDDDLSERIERHRAERPAGWTTVEAPHDLAGAIAAVRTPLVIVDCLTLWVNNLMFRGDDEPAILAEADRALGSIRGRELTAIVVTNEVGLGIVPDNELARRYRDVLGRVNQRWAAAADRALFLVAGLAAELHRPADLLATERR